MYVKYHKIARIILFLVIHTNLVTKSIKLYMGIMFYISERHEL